MVAARQHSEPFAATAIVLATAAAATATNCSLLLRVYLAREVHKGNSLVLAVDEKTQVTAPKSLRNDGLEVLCWPWRRRRCRIDRNTHATAVICSGAFTLR